MRGRTAVPDVFRLLVRIDDHHHVFEKRAFPSLREAQARVAAAVRDGARHGGVRAVLLQRVTALASGPGTPKGQSPQYAWVTEKHWDASVVDRILKQARLASVVAETQPARRARSAPQSTRTPLALARPAPHNGGPVDEIVFDTVYKNGLHAVNGNGHPNVSTYRAAAGPTSPQPEIHPPRPVSPLSDQRSRTPVSARPEQELHRPTRWDMMGAAAFTLAAVVGLFVLQNGGRQLALAAAPAAQLASPALSLDGFLYTGEAEAGDAAAGTQESQGRGAGRVDPSPVDPCPVDPCRGEPSPVDRSPKRERVGRAKTATAFPARLGRSFDRTNGTAAPGCKVPAAP